MNLDYVSMLIIIMVLGFLYRRFMDKYDNEELQNYEKIKKYLLNDSSIAKSKKPVLWIHIPYELNSRSWDSFYSRTNTNLNLPFINLTIQSVIEQCGKSFKICLIDDLSFKNLNSALVLYFWILFFIVCLFQSFISTSYFDQASFQVAQPQII